jgi:hypothetical protein
MNRQPENHGAGIVLMFVVGCAFWVYVLGNVIYYTCGGQ